MEFKDLFKKHFGDVESVGIDHPNFSKFMFELDLSKQRKEEIKEELIKLLS